MSEEIRKYIKRWLTTNGFELNGNILYNFFDDSGSLAYRASSKSGTEYMIFKSKEKLTFRLEYGRTTAYNSISLINIHKVKKIHRMFKIVMEREK